MNSPPDPGSPTDSASSSSTPPPEEVSASAEARAPTSGLMQLASQFTASFSGSSKRRNPPTGSGGPGSSARDPKSRRRGDSTKSSWDTREGVSARKDKDELVDSALVDFLRKELGDPLLEIQTSQ